MISLFTHGEVHKLQKYGSVKNDFPQLQVIKLEQNYRSNQRILHCANTLMQITLLKNVYSSTLEQGENYKFEAKNEEHEAEPVVGELITHRFMHKTNYRDYAILYRGIINQDYSRKPDAKSNSL